MSQQDGVDISTMITEKSIKINIGDVSADNSSSSSSSSGRLTAHMGRHRTLESSYILSSLRCIVRLAICLLAARAFAE